MIRVAVFGAGGYAGLLLARLLARHPEVKLTLLSSERLSTQGQGSAAPGQTWIDASIPIFTEKEAVSQCQKQQIEVALLATPVEMSLVLAPQLLERGVRVLDLSGAFRLPDQSLFERTYGIRHTAPELLGQALYVLPEVTGEDGLRQARLVANPGCFVTAALLALSPLARHGLLLPGAPVFIDGKSGASGAGRRGSVELSLAELEGDLRPYRVGHHQHTPEIAGVLARVHGQPLDVVFVPHLVGTRRGLLVTCHGQLCAGVSGARAREALLHDYSRRPRIHVVPPEDVSLRCPVGTPDAWVGLHVGDLLAGGSGATFCAVASLDNLMKGAASQAVQNLNGMLGLQDGAGLDSLWSAA